MQGKEQQSSNRLFSPVLLAGMVARPLPIAPLNTVVRRLARKMCDNHPAILKRLSDIAGTYFLIDPVDLPYFIDIFVMEDDISAEITRKKDTVKKQGHSDDGEEAGAKPDVVISGSFLSLLDMINSKVDGDSLFFSRELKVEGDIEAVLALRNALDSENIDLKKEFISMFGVLRFPVSLAVNSAQNIFGRLNNDMQTISEAITSPIVLRQQSLSVENEGLREKLNTVNKKLSKQQKQIEKLHNNLQNHLQNCKKTKNK